MAEVRPEETRDDDRKHDQRDELPLRGLSLPFAVHLDRLFLIPQRVLVVLYVLALQVANLFKELDNAVVIHCESAPRLFWKVVFRLTDRA